MGPGRISEKLSGGAGGNMAMRSWPVGGAGYFRGGMSEERVKSTSDAGVNASRFERPVREVDNTPRSELGDNGLR